MIRAENLTLPFQILDGSVKKNYYNIAGCFGQGQN